MKIRKKRRTIEVEKHNALYNKTIKQNGELVYKNTELSEKNNVLGNILKYYENIRWWQFWKLF